MNPELNEFATTMQDALTRVLPDKGAPVASVEVLEGGAHLRITWAVTREEAELIGPEGLVVVVPTEAANAAWRSGQVKGRVLVDRLAAQLLQARAEALDPEIARVLRAPFAEVRSRLRLTATSSPVDVTDGHAELLGLAPGQADLVGYYPLPRDRKQLFWLAASVQIGDRGLGVTVGFCERWGVTPDAVVAAAKEQVAPLLDQARRIEYGGEAEAPELLEPPTRNIRREFGLDEAPEVPAVELELRRLRAPGGVDVVSLRSPGGGLASAMIAFPERIRQWFPQWTSNIAVAVVSRHEVIACPITPQSMFILGARAERIGFLHLCCPTVARMSYLTLDAEGCWRPGLDMRAIAESMERERGEKEEL